MKSWDNHINRFKRRFAEENLFVFLELFPAFGREDEGAAEPPGLGPGRRIRKQVQIRVSSGIQVIPVHRYTVKHFVRYSGLPFKNCPVYRGLKHFAFFYRYQRNKSNIVGNLSSYTRQNFLLSLFLFRYILQISVPCLLNFCHKIYKIFLRKFRVIRQYYLQVLQIEHSIIEKS